MNFEIPSMKLALQVWWAMTWRILPLAIIAGFIVGIVIGVIGALINLEPNSTQLLSATLGAICGFYFSVKIIMRLMVKGFGEYKLVVVRK